MNGHYLFHSQRIAVTIWDIRESYVPTRITFGMSKLDWSCVPFPIILSLLYLCVCIITYLRKAFGVGILRNRATLRGHFLLDASLDLGF